MLQVQDLVDQPDLRLTVLAGAAGLERPVTWAHASDLPQPWDWLAGRELLMKNGRTLPRTASGQIAFFEGLHAAEVSALVIGADPQTPVLSGRARRRADELRLPVLEVPYSMSFLVLSRAVADASREDLARRVARAERIYATIQVAVRRADSSAFLQRLEEELGHRVHVLDAATGDAVLRDPADRPPDPRLVEHVREALAARSGHLPAVIRLPDRGRRSAVLVEVPAEQPTVLVAERSDGRSFDVSMLHHAATAAAVEVAHASLRADFDAQVRAAVLLRALDGRAGATELADTAPDLTSARLLAVAGDAPPATVRRVGAALRRLGVAHLLARHGAYLWVLCPAEQAELVIEAAGEGAAVGTSMPVDKPTRFPEAAREAAWAAGVAARKGARSARYGEPGSLPGLGNLEEAQALVTRVLGPLVNYDAQHGTELATSLRTFLRCRRSWSQTAAALHLHRQTVIYRMRRVSELTGRDLTETGDLAELWLAVTAQELLDDAAAGATSSAG